MSYCLKCLNIDFLHGSQKTSSENAPKLNHAVENNQKELCS